MNTCRKNACVRQRDLVDCGAATLATVALHCRPIAGCLVNVEGLACAYARHLASRPTLGTGVVADGGPMFVYLK